MLVPRSRHRRLLKSRRRLSSRRRTPTSVGTTSRRRKMKTMRRLAVLGQLGRQRTSLRLRHEKIFKRVTHVTVGLACSCGYAGSFFSTLHMTDYGGEDVLDNWSLPRIASPNHNCAPAHLSERSRPPAFIFVLFLSAPHALLFYPSGRYALWTFLLRTRLAVTSFLFVSLLTPSGMHNSPLRIPTQFSFTRDHPVLTRPRPC